MQYHVFYAPDKYTGARYEGVQSLEDILMLRKSQDEGNIYELTVIWGTLIEFEPISVVQLYRIKK